MAEKDIRAFLPIHPVEFRILVLLWRGNPSFMAQLVQDIERRKGTRRAPYPKDLMKAIRGLMESGLLEGSMGPPEGDRGKDWFKISQLGSKVLIAEAKRLKRMVDEATEMGIL